MTDELTARGGSFLNNQRNPNCDSPDTVLG